MDKQNFSAKEAACQYLGCDWDSLQDYRYHAGMTTLPCYVTGNTYIFVTANGKKPPKRDVEYVTNEEGQFAEANDSQAEYCKSRGRTIWTFTAE